MVTTFRHGGISHWETCTCRYMHMYMYINDRALGRIWEAGVHGLPYWKKLESQAKKVGVPSKVLRVKNFTKQSNHDLFDNLCLLSIVSHFYTLFTIAKWKILFEFFLLIPFYFHQKQTLYSYLKFKTGKRIYWNLDCDNM